MNGIGFVLKARLQIVGTAGSQGEPGQADESQKDERALVPGTASLPFCVELMLQNCAALLRLPNLVGVFAFVHGEKFLISLERRLDLVQLIVAERANKPGTRGGWLGFGDDVEARNGSDAVTGKIVGGAEILPVGEVLGIELHRDLQLFFGGGIVVFLHVDAAQAADQLRVIRREERERAAGSRWLRRIFSGRSECRREDAANRRWAAFRRRRDRVRQELRRYCFARRGNERGGRGRRNRMASRCRYLRYASAASGLFWASRVCARPSAAAAEVGWTSRTPRNFVSASAGRLRFEIELGEMESGFGVARIEMHSAFERFGGAGEIAGPFLRDAQENARAALRGQQLDSFAEWRDRRGQVLRPVSRMPRLR